jgi:hypothetical protein
LGFQPLSMKKCILLIFAIYATLYGISQTSDSVKNAIYAISPQAKAGWDHPGNYEIAGSLTRAKINPGEETVLNVNITGYGKIGMSKIYVTTSARIFDPNSKYFSSLSVDPETNLLKFGNDSFALGNDEIHIMTLGGAKAAAWKYSSNFLDSSPVDTTLAITSEDLGTLFKMNLIARKDSIESGDYTVNLHYTYNNSIEWKSSKISIPIHINSRWERNPWLAIAIASFAAFLAIVQVVLNGRTFYINFYKRPRRVKEENMEEPAIVHDGQPEIPEFPQEQVPDKPN